MPADYTETHPLVGASPFARQQSMQGIQDVLSPESKTYSEQLRAYLRQMGIETMPSRYAALNEAILAQQRMAAGSPQQLLTQFNEQINQIQQQLSQQMQTINRQGGYMMGGQRKRAQGAAMGQALGNYQGLMTKGTLGGQSGLLDIVSKVMPVISANIPMPSSQSKQEATAALGEMGGMMPGIEEMLKRLMAPQGAQQAGMGAMNAPFGAPMNFGQMGTNTPLVTNPATYAPAAFGAPSQMALPPPTFNFNAPLVPVTPGI